MNMLRRVSLRFNQYLRRNSTSLPYISGDGFRAVSQRESIAVFFCKSESLEDSLQDLSDIGQDFVLISGNSDRDFNFTLTGVPENLRRLYLQNSFVSDSNLIRTLPIGVENFRHSTNGLPRSLKSRFEFQVKRNQILLGPFGATHAERAELLNLESYRDISVITQRMSPRMYSKFASEFKFVACPRGNGVDTHRIWEALYRGSIPIVLDNPWSQSLDYLGLPIIRIPAWTKDNLVEVLEKYSDFAPESPQNLQYLWIGAWEKLFREDLA
jgi:hypothetical protein